MQAYGMLFGIDYAIEYNRVFNGWWLDRSTSGSIALCMGKLWVCFSLANGMR